MSRIIDVHSHFVLPEYTEYIRRNGALTEDGFPIPVWSIEAHLQAMDQCGVAKSILSLSSPQPYFAGDEAAAVKLCREMNQRAAQWKKAYPDRIGFAACLPLPDVSAAVEEAVYALDVLGTDGIKLASNSRGLYLGAKELEPLMAVLNERATVCNIHPHRPEPLKEGIFTAGPVPLYEFLADTTRAVLNLISSGTIERYPNIRWVVPHCGSFLPNIYERFKGVSRILVPLEMMDDIDVESSVKKLYFDLAGFEAPYLLDLLLNITEPGHILYGGDFPYTPAAVAKEHLRILEEKIDGREDLREYKEDIMYRNAERLYGR